MNQVNATFCQNVIIKFREARQHGLAIAATEVVGAQFLIVDETGPKYVKIIYAAQTPDGVGRSLKTLSYPHDVIQEIDCTSLLQPVVKEDQS